MYIIFYHSRRDAEVKILSHTYSKKTGEEHMEELQVERHSWFLRGCTNDVERAREYGSQWLKRSSSSWVWVWEEVGEGAPLPEGKGFSMCRWKPWRGRMKQHR